MRCVSIGLCALQLAVFTGCRSSPLKPDTSFYPIGIYSVPATNDFDTVRQGGFNVITGPAEQGFLDAAQKAGLKVLSVPGGTQAGAHFNPAAATISVRSLDAHPALWAWYLSDEPDLNLISPDAVVAAQRVVKAAGARKPTALVIYQGYSALDYANLADITMVDRYPIPWLPLANLGQHVEMVRLALGKEKPLIAVIQAFDWTSDKEALPDEKNLRPPTYQEMRCMTYDALARGANGLFYFAFDAGWRMREHPETWSALSNIVQEVNTRLPLFTARRQWWPKAHQFGDPAQRYNAALQSSISSVLLRAVKGNAAIPAGDYILAVNNTPKPIDYSFALPKEGSGRPQPLTKPQAAVPVIGELRALRPEGRRLKDSFGPYAVHIYGPL